MLARAQANTSASERSQLQLSMSQTLGQAYDSFDTASERPAQCGDCPQADASSLVRGAG